jgi:hypothetical protein
MPRPISPTTTTFYGGPFIPALLVQRISFSSGTAQGKAARRIPGTWFHHLGICALSLDIKFLMR